MMHTGNRTIGENAGERSDSENGGATDGADRDDLLRRVIELWPSLSDAKRRRSAEFVEGPGDGKR